jgi:hypothetical protein
MLYIWFTRQYNSHFSIWQLLPQFVQVTQQKQVFPVRWVWNTDRTQTATDGVKTFIKGTLYSGHFKREVGNISCKYVYSEIMYDKTIISIILYLSSFWYNRLREGRES